MANPQHLAWLKEGVKAWNTRRTRKGFVFELLRADLSRADLSRADLSRADLNGANIRTVVIRGVGTNDGGTPLITDLSTVKDLTQEQLDSMRGDSLTKIPSHLTRPTHWPEAEGIPEEPSLNSQSTDILKAKLTRRNRGGFVVKNGRVDPRFKPVNQKPSKKGHADCPERLDALLDLLRDMLEAIANSDSGNKDQKELTRAVQKLFDAMYIDRPNWFRVDDRLSILNETLDYDAVAPWLNDEISSCLNRFQKAFDDFEPCIRPPHEEEDGSGPKPHLPANGEEIAREAGLDMQALAENPDAEEVMTPTTQDLIDDTGESLAQEVDDEENLLPIENKTS